LAGRIALDPGEEKRELHHEQGPLGAAAARDIERPRWWRDIRRRRMLGAADLLAAAAGSLTTVSAAGLWAFALISFWIVLAKMLGLYDRDHKAIRHLTVDEVPYLALWSLGGAAFLALVLPLTGADDLSSGSVAVIAIVAFVTTFVLRGGARWLWRSTVPPERTVVLGDGELAAVMRRKIRIFPDMHLELVGDTPRIAELGSDNGGNALDVAVRDSDRIIVATENVDARLIGDLAVACRENQTKLSVASNLRGRALPVPKMTQVAELPMFEFDTWDVPRSTMLLKRCFDLVVSIVGLILLIPLVPLIALAIKLDDRGSVLFAQRRAGLDGRPFRMLKFRTMSPDAEDRLGEVVRLDELREPMFKLTSDPRVTRVGRVLRRFSLDEAPQLINVLMGQMSIVGPRPEQVEIVERYGPEHMFRLQVKPGMTGPMQVYGRGALTFAERLAAEADYIENISVLRDAKIVARTLPVVLRGTGAY
jgi:exopolysaccharide biosynthesis polyprenyl glycosylphosphotransferase